MVTDQDFLQLGLDNFLTKSKYAIDTLDPEQSVVAQAALQAFKAMECYSVINQFIRSYHKHGYNETLVNDYRPKYERLGLHDVLLDEANIPASLTAAEQNATTKLAEFNTQITQSQYLPKLEAKFQSVAAQANDIMADINTSSQAADTTEFAQTQLHGFDYTTYTNRSKGLVKLLGAINTYDPLKYRKYSLRDEQNSLGKELVAAGFSFNLNLIVEPHNDRVYEYATLEQLGWSPTQVAGVSDDLASIYKLMPKLDQALEETELDQSQYTQIKNTCTLLENRYNLRKILHVVKYTTITLSNQYIAMGRAFR